MQVYQELNTSLSGLHESVAMEYRVWSGYSIGSFLGLLR